MDMWAGGKGIRLGGIARVWRRMEEDRKRKRVV